MVPRARPSPHPIRHLDRFNLILLLTAHGYVQRTDTHTEHETSVTIRRIFVSCASDTAKNVLVI